MLQPHRTRVLRLELHMRWLAQQAASMCTSISVVVLKPNQCVEFGDLDGRQ